MGFEYSTFLSLRRSSIVAIALDCKSSTQAVNIVGSSPTLRTIAEIVQLVEHHPDKVACVGSSPALSTIAD